MTPHMFPVNFTSEVDIGCGYMNLESRLMKCDDGIAEESRNCVTLVKTVALSYILSDQCELDGNDEQVDDAGALAWVMQKVGNHVDFSSRLSRI